MCASLITTKVYTSQDGLGRLKSTEAYMLLMLGPHHSLAEGSVIFT